MVDSGRNAAMDYFTNSASGHDFCDEICRMSMGESYGIQAWIGYDDDM